MHGTNFWQGVAIVQTAVTCPDCQTRGNQWMLATSEVAFVNYFRCGRCGYVWTVGETVEDTRSSGRRSTRSGSYSCRSRWNRACCLGQKGDRPSLRHSLRMRVAKVQRRCARVDRLLRVTVISFRLSRIAVARARATARDSRGEPPHPRRGSGVPMRSVGGFSAFSLRDQLISILHAQIDIAFGYVGRAQRDGGANRGQLRFAERTYQAAVDLRRKVDLEGEDTEEIDRDLDRLFVAISDAGSERS